MPIDDLRQAAYFGLRCAAERFDPERGVLFSTFAFHRLRNAIQCALPNLLGVVRVPRAASFPRPRMASLDDQGEGAPEPEDESTVSAPPTPPHAQRTASASAPLWASSDTSVTPESSPCGTGSTVRR